MRRWTIDDWIAYLMHPASRVLLKIISGRHDRCGYIVVTSGEGTERIWI